jgi:hypothetical protein
MYQGIMMDIPGREIAVSAHNLLANNTHLRYQVAIKVIRPRPKDGDYLEAIGRVRNSIIVL